MLPIPWRDLVLVPGGLLIEYYYGVERQWQPVLPGLGLGSSDDVFNNSKIQVWRSIPERENGVLDATIPDGRQVRLHVKRYHRQRTGRGGWRTPGQTEAEAIFLLQRAKIPTVPLVAWGWLPDRRSFIISEDLEGYEAADKLVERGTPFERVLEPIATLAGDLHRAGLHHRDLYLCHFFVKLGDGGSTDVRLIDAARVRPLPRLFRKRWIVKDLAQLWYSTLSLSAITDAQRERVLQIYAEKTGASVPALRPAIERKTRWIAEHDAKLREKQPDRNVSIPAGRA